jgi:hypothetical protein
VSAYVVDTGVCVVANGSADVSTECELAAVRLLRSLQEDGHVLVDDVGLIIAEYARNLSHAGRPGVGDAFFVWLRDSQWSDSRCSRVPVTPRADDTEDLEEFPRDAPGLSTFDRADRKFVGTALAYGAPAKIAVCVDRGWWAHRQALADAGADVDFLCPDLFGG